MDQQICLQVFLPWAQLQDEGKLPLIKVANTVLAVSDYMSFAKLWLEKGCYSQAETWQVENILMKDFE